MRIPDPRAQRRMEAPREGSCCAERGNVPDAASTAGTHCDYAGGPGCGSAAGAARLLPVGAVACVWAALPPYTRKRGREPGLRLC